ncbi:hypothetical protein NM208_g2236 [Fusarium decemcellulare]|uniref:Uncharacterized protein n=2 Tax=Fusarium decemcellulare TaxID=57161 RepID=A0ACC1SMW5_9HYPO|nr:hypothetical protein NM208_g3803 [Fusarium decemcellulare]KAJ3545980.1 hypothetical protein NM208_g2236 [Fusarium decemcellulare]
MEQTASCHSLPDQIDLDAVKHWLSNCETNHKDRCHQKRFPESPKGSPGICVIDVIDYCVVEATLSARYFALSYVWGGVDQLQHVTANATTLKQAGALKDNDEIPGTIADAMKFVQALGERFIWVDSLCICQDDTKEKAAQIAQMAEIYDGALATVVACTAESANSSLPGIGPASRSDAYPIGDDLLITALVKSPHRQRAWTFQEVVLSRRCLFFFSDKLVFQCQGSRCIEGKGDEEQIMMQNMAGNWPPVEGVEGGMLLKHEFRYGELVHDFTRRNLTVPSDRLDAFTGLLSILKKAWRWDFQFAVPAQIFGWALLWVPEDPIARDTEGLEIMPVRDSSDFLFPSWSWLLHPGASYYFLEFLGPQSQSLKHYVDWAHTTIWTGSSATNIVKSKDEREGGSLADMFKDYPPGTLVIMGWMANLAGLGEPKETSNFLEFRTKREEYQRAGNVYAPLVNDSGQWYGTLVGISEHQIKTKLSDGEELSLVLLSSARQTWVMGGFKRKIACFDYGEFEDKEWCTVNVMLITTTSRPYRRLAIGEVYCAEWDELQPEGDLIWLA